MKRHWLKKMREERGLKKEEISLRADIDVFYLYDIENGKRVKNMTYNMMVKLAKGFGVPVQEIIDAEQDYVKSREASA